MSIIGVGIDVAEIERFAASLERTPGLARRLFLDSELLLPGGGRRGVASLAARFAAKEALAKALGAPRRAAVDGRRGVRRGERAAPAAGARQRRRPSGRTRRQGLARVAQPRRGRRLGGGGRRGLSRPRAAVQPGRLDVCVPPTVSRPSGGRTGADGAAPGRRADAARRRRARRGLRRPAAGGCTARRVVLLVGSGDNGGDALYAGARLARRGRRGHRVLLAPERAHAGGLARPAPAAGRRRGGRGRDAGRGAPRGPTSSLDGIVGIGGRGGLRPRRPRRSPRAAEARRGRRRRRPAQRRRRRHRRGDGRRASAPTLTVTFGTHKPGLLIDPAREYAGSGAPRRHRARPAPAGDARARGPAARRRRRAAAACPAGESDKYRRGVVGVAAGSARYPGAAVLAVAGALRGGAGAVRYVGPRPGTRSSPASRRRSSPTGGPRAGRARAGLGGRARAPATTRAPVAEVLAADVPVLVDADGLRLAEPDAVRAPHRADAAHPARRRGRRAARRRPGGGRGGPAGARCASWRRATARRCCSRGRRRWSPTPAATAPVRVNATGTPWLATAGSGDVLSGLAGSLLAAGLSALRRGQRRRLPARPGRPPRGPGAPVGAHDVAEAIPRPGAPWGTDHRTRAADTGFTAATAATAGPAPR